MYSKDIPERFCSYCARKLVPLETPHLSSDCAQCGRTSYYVRHDAASGGIKIEAGEKFIIPAGFIKLSLQPSPQSKLFRSGLPFLLKQFFLCSHPKTADDFPSFLETLSMEAEDILKSSPVLSGLNFENETDAAVVFDHLKEKTETREFYAASMGALVQEVSQAIDESDAQQSAWAGYMLGTIRGLTIVTEPLFEQTLWRGYLANDVVYEAISAASRTPAEAEAIKLVAPLFQRLDEMTLHTWVDSQLPIGPRVGIKDLPEETLLALAKWHLSSFQRHREDDIRAAGERRATWELRLKWLGTGLAIPAVTIAVLKFAALVEA